jgi:hypothetical protein
VARLKLENKAFRNVKNQLGYCAIWCGSCVVGNGALKEVTKKYEHIIDGYGIDEWGAQEQGFNGQKLMKSLKGIQDISICFGCRKGGGNLSCKIRPCASNKKLNDCTECKDFMKCENRESLEKVRTGAFNVGMIVKTEKDRDNQQRLIKKWTSEIAARFPSCIILCERDSE